MKVRTSIHYLFAHRKLRDLVFENWAKMNELLMGGPVVIQKYFYSMWNDLKNELNNREDIEIIDKEIEINATDFQISYSILGNNIKAFNFIMPEPITDYAQAKYVTLVLTEKMPRYFTLELCENSSKHFSSEMPENYDTDYYIIGEWQIDFENNDYKHINYGQLGSSNIGEFLGKINKIITKC